MAGDGVVGNAYRNPHGTLLNSFANHLKHPHLILVGDGERLARRSVAMLCHEVCHHVKSLACGLGTFEGHIYQRTVIHD